MESIESSITLWQKFQQPGWDVKPTPQMRILVLEVPTAEDAEMLVDDGINHLAASAVIWKCDSVIIRYPGCGDFAYQIPASMARNNNPGINTPMEGNLKTLNNRLLVPKTQAISSKNFSVQQVPENSSDSPLDFSGLGLPGTFLKDASFEEIQEFMGEMRHRGYIVTATDMMTNHCLMVNDLQAPDRGGGWKGKDWIGLNFILLWKDSFQPGNFNYFDYLINTLQRDYYLPDFEYLLRAPNGDLRQYYSYYFYTENYLDTSVRICVSKPGNWETVRVANN